ncbi:MAG: c-type cytochrome [Nitrospirae bacterium]|nr:c-type cytochrome [Nitrospirota bacterium]
MNTPARLIALLLPASLLFAALPARAGQDAPQTPSAQTLKLGLGLVEHLGCLFCHGLGGRQGLDNPNAKERKRVPAWDDPEFAKRYPDPAKVRQTIREGRFPERDPAATSNPIPMPPWGNRLTDPEMDAIIAYIWSLRETPTASHPKGGRWKTAELATGTITQPLPPEDTEVTHEHGAPGTGGNALVEKGRGLVGYLGCLHCHGLGDSDSMPNPNARRDPVPRWDDAEFVKRYWVDDGVRYVIEKGRRPQKAPGATDEPVPMPPFGNMLDNQEMDAIIAYIWSLREQPMAPAGLPAHDH